MVTIEFAGSKHLSSAHIFNKGFREIVAAGEQTSILISDS